MLGLFLLDFAACGCNERMVTRCFDIKYLVVRYKIFFFNNNVIQQLLFDEFPTQCK